MNQRLQIQAGLIVLLVSAGISWSATLDVSQSGAVGDGTTLNTTAIQKAIDTLSAQGGGTLNFPAGRYLTGTIELKDNVTLHLDDQAVILGSTNAADYRNIDPFTDGTGNPLGYALIIARKASHVGIDGGGTIDGQGKAVAAAQKKFTIRPFLIRWIQCTDVGLRSVTLSNPGAWTNQFFQCKNVIVNHVTIRSAAAHLANNDGIDIDSCQGVRVTDCDIDSGDDAICIKATSPQPSKDINISNCQLQTRCNGIKFGTESIGDFENVHASHCQLRNIGLSGIALYAVDGAHLHDVTINDISIDAVPVAISVRLGARLKTFREGDHAKPVGTLSDVSISDVRATRVKQIGLLINGIPGHPIENLKLKNIQIELVGGGTAQDAEIQLAEKEAAYPEMNMFGKVMPAYGAYLRHVKGAICENVSTSTTRPDSRPMVALIDADGVTAADFHAAATTQPISGN